MSEERPVQGNTPFASESSEFRGYANVDVIPGKR